MNHNTRCHESSPGADTESVSGGAGGPRTNRRAFFHACFALMTTVAGAVVVFPIVSFLRLPKRIMKTRSIEVPLAELSEDQALFFDREGMQIVLVYTDRVPKAFDAACTHLGCLVAWDQNEHVFHCPCHGAVFDDRGAAVKGPVNTPLKKIGFEIKKDVLIIA